MAETLPTVTLDSEWRSVEDLVGIEAGTGLVVQNQGRNQVLYAASDDKPADDFMGVIVPPSLTFPLVVEPDSPMVWLRSRFPGVKARVNIQVDS